MADAKVKIDSKKNQAEQGPPVLRWIGGSDFIARAQMLVYCYVKSHLEKTDTHVEFNPSDVYVVWFAYTLGNWKALLSTRLPDGMYYEVTHSKAHRMDYLDAYKKFQNVAVPSDMHAMEFFNVQPESM